MFSTTNMPRKGCAGDDGADAAECESAVDGEAETASGSAFAGLVGGCFEMRAQLEDAVAGNGVDRENRGSCERRCRKQGPGLFGRCRQPICIHQACFGQCDGAPADTEQFDDFQMLTGLRHRAIVGSDHQQHKVDAGRAGQHVVDQLFVAGNVDEAEHAVHALAEFDLEYLEQPCARVDELAELRERIAVRLRDAKMRIADADEILRDRTKAAARATDDYVNDNPWRAVGIAAGVGLLLGVIIARR